jgi:hypothetical protein
MKIIVSGPAAAFDSSGNPITGAAELQKLDGLVEDEFVCSEFLDGELDEIGLTGGALKIVYDSSTNRLRVVTEFGSPRKLKKSELMALADDTRGQWSDGLGEGAFDDLRQQTGISISCSPSGIEKCTVSIEQADDGAKIPRPKRTSPLFKAAEAGDIDKIEKLLAKGEDINSRNKYDWTPLIAAIRKKQTEAALLLIERGADVKLLARWSVGGEQELETAIVWAAMQGDLLVLHRLIAAGADVDTRNQDGKTPAMFAANRGFLDLLQALIDAGCNLNLQNTQEGYDGHTVLFFADPQRLDIVELLLEHGADPKIRNYKGQTAAEKALTDVNSFMRSSPAAALRAKAEMLQRYGG